MCLRVGCVFMLYALCLQVYTGHGADIINGKEVEPHSMPFMALLETKNGPVCGGILISEKWVLTAAHCYSDSLKIQRVLLGVHNIKNKEKDPIIILEVKEQIRHPCYDSEIKLNDIMLLKLKKSVKETKTVKILPLKKVVYPATGSSCVVAGWGRTKNNAKRGSDVLMSVNVTVIDRAKCNSPDYYNGKPDITNKHICAGSDGTNAADSCQGDSGGPLLCRGQLVGVTSFGSAKCGETKKPGVYAFLSSKILEWIKSKI